MPLSSKAHREVGFAAGDESIGKMPAPYCSISFSMGTSGETGQVEDRFAFPASAVESLNELGTVS